MAECKNLDVRFMDGVAKETNCASCVHRKVCVYKEIYLEYLSACDKMHRDYPDDISFIERRNPFCNFYEKKSDVNFR